MRYEVRMPDGKLIGFYTGFVKLGGQVVMHTMDRLKLEAFPAHQPLTLDIKQIVLEEVPYLWENGSKIPTLVLREGKRSWLNKQRDFRRL